MRYVDKPFYRLQLAARDGASALDFLLGQGDRQPYEKGAERMQPGAPCLILLDLNLHSRQNKGRPHLRRSPAIVPTTADDQREIQRRYDLGANIYIAKPLIYENFANAIRQPGLFLSVIQIPEID